MWSLTVKKCSTKDLNVKKNPKIKIVHEKLQNCAFLMNKSMEWKNNVTMQYSNESCAEKESLWTRLNSVDSIASRTHWNKHTNTFAHSMEPVQLHRQQTQTQRKLHTNTNASITRTTVKISIHLHLIVSQQRQQQHSCGKQTFNSMIVWVSNWWSALRHECMCERVYLGWVNGGNTAAAATTANKQNEWTYTNRVTRAQYSLCFSSILPPHLFFKRFVARWSSSFNSLVKPITSDFCRSSELSGSTVQSGILKCSPILPIHWVEYS